MDLFEEFAEALLEGGKSDETVQGYVNDLRIFMRWFEQRYSTPFSLDRVTSEDVQNFCDSLRLRGLSNATVWRRLQTLRAFFRWAIGQGLCAENPAAQVRPPLPQKQRKKEVRWLERDEQQRLLRFVEQQRQPDARLPRRKNLVARVRDAATVLVLLNGLQGNEVVQLRMDDISPDAGWLEAGRGHSRRRVPLTTAAHNALRDWLSLRPDTQEPYVFLTLESSRPHQKMVRRNVLRIVNWFGKQVGIENLTPHVLRHTFAKRLVDAGVSLEKVAALLGLTDWNALRVYCDEPDFQALRQAVKRLEKE